MVKRLGGALLLLMLAAGCRAEPVQIGVVEQPQCAEIPAVRARVMFVETREGWRAVDSDYNLALPRVEGLNWTLGFNGKNLGRITLKDPNPGTPKQTDAFFSRDKLYKPYGKIPLQANPMHLFEGWCAAPTARPLVIVSAPHVADPQEWKAFSPGVELRHQLYPALRIAMGRTQVAACLDAETARTRPEYVRETDLLLGRAYRSRNGEMLVSIAMAPLPNGCDGPSGAAWSTHWFLIRQGVIDFIGREMELVDVGDYAGDGKTEFLFWTSSYNEDGYVLVYDDLRREARYTWSYH